MSADSSLPGLYVHVPFCRSKCRYCGFYSRTDLRGVPRWLEALETEARLYEDFPGPFDSLYVGGGTPSVLSPDRLGRLISSLAERFDFREDSEITLEANPDDLSLELLRECRSLGFNRISIGIQSLNDDELRFLGRRHDGEQGKRALSWARRAGFRRIGVDLIYGLPGQPFSRWLRTLRAISAFQPDHVSCYQLTVEEGTVFHKMEREGGIRLGGEEEQRDFFLGTSRFLEKAGFIHYEVSNFAAEELCRSRHNVKYWSHVSYLGLGPSAHSFHQDRRWWNASSLDGYCRWVEEGRKPVDGEEVLSEEQKRLEALYLGFRTREGVPLKALENDADWREAVRNLQRSGLILVQGERVVSTRKGWAVADGLPLCF